MYEFTITGIVLEEDKGELQLQGKFHPVFTSMVFLKLPPSELAGRKIGDKFILTSAPEMVQRGEVAEAAHEDSDRPESQVQAADEIERKGGYQI